MTIREDSLVSHWRQLPRERNQHTNPPMTRLVVKLKSAVERIYRAQQNTHQCE